MPQTSRTFRIFVSSTFSDLKAERNALQEKVFPRLRDLATAHGCRFQAIDLRWGVSEEAALDQQTMKICLGEIERCQKTSPRPNFIVLLGDRYGWRPLPAEIPADEFEKIIAKVAKDEKVLLEKWYRRDDNALPPVYCLQPRSGEFVEYKAWEKVENNLRQTFLSAIEKLAFSADATLKYTASATDQEIVAGALKVTDADEHVFCYFRGIEGLAKDERRTSEGRAKDQRSKEYRDADVDAAQKQAELKERLRRKLPGNVHEYKARWQGEGPSLNHLDQLCEDVYADLSKVILAETGKLEKVDSLEAEITAHETFGKDRARVFIGRADILNSIEKYIVGSDPHPLAIWGASGSGKSALMAKAIEQAQKKGQDVLYRFIGATPESSNGRALLESLCKQISRRYGADESTIPSEYKDLVQEFPKRLALVKPDKPLIIFLDALDQLSDTDNARNPIWLPAELPQNVRLIVSTLSGECLQALENKVPVQNKIEVKAMSMEDGEAILDTWLSGSQRRLQDEQKKYILDKFNVCGLPLYLKLAFEETKLWKSYDALPELGDDIPTILQDLFKRLSKESNHGEMLVSHSLGYLAAAKNGLSEDELLDMLSLDKEVQADFRRRSSKSPKSDRLPVVIWSRLYFDLEPYLTERSADGTSLLAFYHRQMSEICQKEYRNKERHHTQARYFDALPLYLDESRKTPNQRKLSELVYQQAWAGLRNELEEKLLDFTYLEAKIAGQGLQELIEDYDWPSKAGLQLERNKTLSLLQEALRISTFVLAKDLRQLPNQLHGRLAGITDPGIQGLLAQACREVSYPWFRPIRPCFTQPGGPERFTLSGHSFFIESIAFSPDGQMVVTGGKDGLVKIHDLHTGTVTHVLSGNNNPVSCVVVTPDGRSILAGLMGGIIKVWEMETGREKFDLSIGSSLPVKIIEVSPDSNQAVSFAYDIEPAFDKSLKVWDLERGTERYSLEDFVGPIRCMAVASDGKTAVHGAIDGTIKVWDLETGGLKFILSGHTAPVKNLVIAPNGRLLATSAHAPKPIGIGPGRFIEQDIGPWAEDHSMRVWDLETGEEKFTMLGHAGEINVIKITPDSESVLSGSEDGIVKVWDLKSGVEKLTLVGHTATICCLAVTPDSCLVVSSASTPERIGDGPDKDHSPRVWDLQTGEIRFTLSGHTGWINSLDILPDGRTLLSSSMDQTLRLWNLDVGNETLCLPGSGPVVNPSGRLLVSGSEDNTLKVWDLDSGGSIRPLAKHDHGVRSLMITPNEKLAVTAGKEKEFVHYVSDFYPFATFPGSSIKVWSIETGEELHTFPEPVNHFNGMAIGPGGKLLASASANNKLDVIDLETGSLKFSSDGSYPVAIAPDGKSLVSSALDCSIKVINLDTGNVKWNKRCHAGEIRTISISPDGKFVLTGSNDKTLKLWELDTGMEKLTLTGHVDEVLTTVITPNGQTAMSASKDGKVIVWDLNSGGQKFSLPGSYPLAISPDGRLAVIGKSHLAKNVLKVINLTSGNEMGELTGHVGPVNGLAISPDGRWVISAAGSDFYKSKDDTLKIWDLEKRENIVTFYANESFECNPGLTAGPWRITIGDETGQMYFLQMEKLALGPSIVTPWASRNSYSFGCPKCLAWSEVLPTVLGTEVLCPKCGKAIKLNTFNLEGNWHSIEEAWLKGRK
jgi:WD40 repeat protein